MSAEWMMHALLSKYLLKKAGNLVVEVHVKLKALIKTNYSKAEVMLQMRGDAGARMQAPLIWL